MAQYTMIYDLLGISALTDENWFPPYIQQQRQDQLSNIQEAYTPGGMNAFFFKGNTSLVTLNKSERRELTTQWIAAISQHPYAYAQHRWYNFSSMLRIGYFTPAWVGEPGIWNNNYGFSFTPNPISNFLALSIKLYPWMYIPWIYAVICILSYCLLRFYFKKTTGTYLFLAVVAFVAPHFFVLPAADYRYLYFAYLGTFALFAMNFTNSESKT